MTHRQQLLRAALLLFALIVVLPARAESIHQVTIGVLAYNGKQQALSRWQPTAEYLTHAIPGYHFRIDPLFLQEMNRAARDGRIQFVLTQPLQFVDLSRRYKIWPLATLKADVRGHNLDRFGATIIARSDRTDINSIQDLKDKIVAGVAPNALGGWLLGVDTLGRDGIDPKRDILKLFVGLPMGQVVAAVLDGRADAGIIRAGMLEHLTDTGVITPGSLKVLGTKHYANYPFKTSTELVPEWPLAATPAVSQKLAREVRRALLSMPADSRAAETAGLAGWTLPLDYSTVTRIRDQWMPNKPSLAQFLTAYWPWLLLPIGLVLLIFYLQSLRIQRQLAEREKRLSAALNSLHDAVSIISSDGRIRFANQAVAGLLRAPGMRPRNIVDQFFCDVFSIRWSESHRDCDLMGEIDQLQQTHELEHELILEHGRQHKTVNIRLIRMDSRIGTMPERIVISMQDVTDLRDATALLSYRATHDRLTGLLNRSAFEETLGQQVAEIARHSGEGVIMWLDLDDFRLINEAGSHKLGDELICRVASHLSMELPPKALLARLGVDEFGIWLPDHGVLHARSWPEELLQSIRDFRMDHDGHRISVTASIGICLVDQRNAMLPTLLKEAESACRSAHRLGGNRILIHTEDDKELQLRRQQLDCLQMLKEAIDDDAFFMQAQEIRPLDSRTHQSHWELLIRLKQANGETSYPGQFIEVAEKYHFMPQIDRWVVRKALQTMEALGEEARPFAVNLSGASVQDPEMAKFIRDLFGTVQVDPSLLCFEITETAAIANFDQAERLMGFLREQGCKVSLDDFGGGLLSFEFMRRLQPDYVKIDGKLVRDMIDDPVAEVIVGAIHQVSTVMGAQTIAEWVENQAILDRLTSIGVTYVQGYLIHKPEPLDGLFTLPVS